MKTSILKVLRFLFGLTYKEANGFQLLAMLLLIVVFLPRLTLKIMPDPEIPPMDSVRIDSVMRLLEAASAVEISVPSKEKTPIPPKPKWQVLEINLNKTDTTELKRIRGIGSVLSRRIIAYRNLLGGFVNVGQLYEVYGLDSSVVAENSDKFMISGEFEPLKIKINNLGIEELARHPYLSYRNSRVIVNYREQHGNYSSINDLLQSIPLPDSVARKIEPYLDF